jgi:hypothetical protein
MPSMYSSVASLQEQALPEGVGSRPTRFVQIALLNVAHGLVLQASTSAVRIKRNQSILRASAALQSYI